MAFISKERREPGPVLSRPSIAGAQSSMRSRPFRLAAYNASSARAATSFAIWSLRATPAAMPILTVSRTLPPTLAKFRVRKAMRMRSAKICAPSADSVRRSVVALRECW